MFGAETSCTGVAAESAARVRSGAGPAEQAESVAAATSTVNHGEVSIRVVSLHPRDVGVDQRMVGHVVLDADGLNGCSFGPLRTFDSPSRLPKERPVTARSRQSVISGPFSDTVVSGQVTVTSDQSAPTGAANWNLSLIAENCD